MEINKSVNSFQTQGIKADLTTKKQHNIDNNESNLDKSYHLDIKDFKIFKNNNKIKVNHDIKVPKELKQIWNELIKDGILTNNDYQKIINSSMKLKTSQKTYCQEFIKKLGDKLQENKGIISFIDNDSEISLKELKESLK